MTKMQEEKKPQTKCQSEFGQLTHVVVCPPAYMEIRKVINETQKHYLNHNIDQHAAMEQHTDFVKVLRDNGVDVMSVPAKEPFNEQVYTRDIGFCIGDTLFVSNMEDDIRKGETKILREWLKEQGLTYKDVTEGTIEGGDVVVDGQRIWIGLSKRTDEKAVQQIQQQLPDYEVIPVKIREDILHLDCVFNLVRDDLAILYPDAFNKEDLERFRKLYKTIEISEEEQFYMGTNILSFAPDKLLSLPSNKRVNEALRKEGVTVIEVNFSEIIKSGGSFRCCSLPLQRQ
ncbi:dimethylarginine dimethylaminohydrolase family protein [Terribacillus saccharophilus]|uniref:dimethylarginine dimethylaminohydrolase family protein n=1 Tax=Terribacillus saccharophilus TaxID=361277 RepID=UPI002DD13B48|nr:dimethylarginine dimethylaminohydrolase family protein [Terribacillus saccharophilus]